jgi:hypothetical protein
VVDVEVKNIKINGDRCRSKKHKKTKVVVVEVKNIKKTKVVVVLVKNIKKQWL